MSERGFLFMVMLCGGSDSFGLIVGLSLGDGVWPALPGWLEPGRRRSFGGLVGGGHSGQSR
jgi:hypothetical protein